MKRNIIVGAVEIGTAKVLAAIGEIEAGRGLSIIGMGEAPAKGVKKGEVIDFEAASTATHSALAAAEESAGIQLKDIYLSQTGSHLKGFFNEGFVNVSDSDNHVKQSDINRAIQEAKGKKLSSDRVYIHHIQNPFKLDGRVVSNPYGMQGAKLGVGYWSVHGHVAKVRDQIHILNGYGIKVKDMIISSIASGYVVANEAEKENGVLVLDIGRGTTDYVVYDNGYVIKTGVIPVGGDHITNDISLGLRIDSSQAESIKLEYASAKLDPDHVWEKVDVDSRGVGGSKRQVSRQAIVEIVNARVEELFKIISTQVEEVCPLKNLAAGVILTGGTSRLLEIENLAADILQTNVRLGENPSWASGYLREPEYATVLGLLNYALVSNGDLVDQKNQSKGLWAKMTKALSI